MMISDYRSAPRWSSDLIAFFLLAFAITWLLDLPFALATLRDVPPPAHALPLVGLGALGPSLAALAVGLWRRELRDIFGRWRTNPIWILIGLFTVMAVHLPATIIEVALGGHPARWVYLPAQPERVMGLIFFSVGEEFGWRGFAYPRLARRLGPVIGCVILGTLWSLWHLGMMFTPGRYPDIVQLGASTVELVAGSLVFAWVFEKGRRSMAVAIALHAGAHLDNVTLAPAGEVRLRLLRLAVWIIVGIIAAIALSRMRRRDEVTGARIRSSSCS